MSLAGQAIRTLRNPQARRKWWGLFFVTPAVLFFIVFSIYPMISGLILSLTDFTLLRPPVWVGLENFQELLTDRLFQKAVGVTFGFVIGSTVPVWIISLLAALLFFQSFWGREALKAIFFSPVLPSLVVVGIAWKVLLHPSGILTSVIGPFVGQSEIRWLNDVRLSPLSMVIASDWATIPFYMLIWLAALTGIPHELREAALVDGANRVQSFLRVELPLLRPTVVFIAAISSITAFQAFTLQFLISPDKGGPVDVNTTFGLLIWKYGFQFYRMGAAAAVSVVLFIIIMIVTIVQLVLGRSESVSLT